MSQRAIVYWFRRDLRLADNQGLSAAAGTAAVAPLFIHADEVPGEWPAGGASRWWLHHSLEALGAALRACGSRLILRAGSPLEVLEDVVRESGASAVYCERVLEPQALAQDAEIRTSLARAGVDFRTFDGALLTAPERVRSAAGKPFRVFTPFWRTARTLVQPDETLSAPARFVAPDTWPSSVPISTLGLTPHIDWAAGLRHAWQPGEVGATVALGRFESEGVGAYSVQRDFPARPGTSRLSPHLHFGEVSVRSVWRRLLETVRTPGETSTVSIDPYLRQLGWREFAYHILYHFPHTPTSALDPTMDDFPWAYEEEQVERWRRGLTGFPIVDAGMRQLWHTGWMHNRVRMVAASFLVKDLLCDWRVGAAWFWDTLVDADLANNTLGWQWAAGCGADAAPYFRVFNPVLQGQKFDPDGRYVRHWLPELARLDLRWLHAPWTAPSSELARAGITLGQEYPSAIVDHAKARTLALAALATTRRRAAAR